MGQIPQEFRYLSKDQRWKPIKDEIRSLACDHGLTHMPDNAFKIDIWVDHEPLSACCDFKERADALEIFGMYVEGH